MTKEEIFKALNENPVMHLATVDEKGFPRVRGILMFKADENGIVFHTGEFKDLHRQLGNNPKAELCFQCKGVQIRVSGEFVLDESEELFEEIVNHPSREFLRKWGMSHEERRAMLKVYRMAHGTATIWSMADNFKPKEFIQL